MSEPLPIPGLKGDDADVATNLFGFVSFLLDDDGNLTPSGNLNATGRALLRGRLGELLAPRAATLDDAPDDAAEPAPEAEAATRAAP
jgi:hypothetical protein